MRFIYRNRQGGHSIATEHSFDIGNFDSYMRAVEVASRDCSHVADLTAPIARELAKGYRTQATALWLRGHVDRATDVHGWALYADIAAGQIEGRPIRTEGEAAVITDEIQKSITAAYAS